MPVEYVRWRKMLFGDRDTNAFDDDPVNDTWFDHIDKLLIDPDVHRLYSKEQIGQVLNRIYYNTYGDDAACLYLNAGDEERRIRAINSMKYLYANFFERYCRSPVVHVGYGDEDGEIGHVCYMLWDVFILCPSNSSPRVTDAVLGVMEHGIRSLNDNCIASAIHGLGHWAWDPPRVPAAVDILREWLLHPTTSNDELIDYAEHAMTRLHSVMAGSWMLCHFSQFSQSHSPYSKVPRSLSITELGIYAGRLTSDAAIFDSRRVCRLFSLSSHFSATSSRWHCCQLCC
jgi:hypothetical protein